MNKALRTIAKLARWSFPRRGAARLAADESGQAAVIMAVSLIPLLGMLGLTVDTSQWVLWKRSLRSAADLSALAGARAKTSTQAVNNAVRSALGHNDQRSYTIESIENPPTSGPGLGDANAVRVVLSTSQALPFSSMFLSQAPTIKVEATATIFGASQNCVLGLDRSTATAVTVSGSATLNMSCGIFANSSGAPALKADGQTVNVTSLSAVGTITAGTGVPSTTKVLTGQTALPDPYAALPLPDPGSACSGAVAVSVKSMTVETINPGCYSSIKSLGTLYMNPGIYYIDGGDFAVGSQSEVEGVGVTIIFTNTSDPTRSGRLNTAGNSYVRLSAMTSGTYAGILMYQDPRTTGSNSTSFWASGTSYTGSSGPLYSYYRGAMYSPASEMHFTGNSGLNTPCMQIVALQVVFTGNTSVTNNCPAGSGAGSFGSGPMVKLIG